MLKSTKEIEQRNDTEVEEEKHNKAQTIREIAESHKQYKPASLDDMQAMFDAVYRYNIEREPLPSIAFHLLEEVGEVAAALLGIYSYHDLDLEQITPDVVAWRLAQLEDEIADITSWVFALVVKLDQDTNDVRDRMGALYEEAGPLLLGPFRLGRMLWSSYHSKDKNVIFCQRCGSVTCTCPITYLTDADSVALVASQFGVAQKTRPVPLGESTP